MEVLDYIETVDRISIFILFIVIYFYFYFILFYLLLIELSMQAFNLTFFFQ